METELFDTIIDAVYGFEGEELTIIKALRHGLRTQTDLPDEVVNLKTFQDCLERNGRPPEGFAADGRYIL